MDQFSFEMQHLLDDFVAGNLTFDKLVADYEQIGSEQYQIREFRFILDHAKQNRAKIKLHAGVMPWTFAE